MLGILQEPNFSSIGNFECYILKKQINCEKRKRKAKKLRDTARVFAGMLGAVATEPPFLNHAIV
jgi:hypothetical protein